MFNGQEDPENPVYLSEKRVHYVFLFLKVSQCKLKQKETILKLGNPLKRKSKVTNSKIGLGASTSTTYQSFTLNLLGAFWPGRIFSPSIILKSPPIKICSENTDTMARNIVEVKIKTVISLWNHTNQSKGHNVKHKKVTTILRKYSESENI